MTRFACLLLVAAAAVAGATPAPVYPVVIPTQTAAQIAQREAAFRAKNPQHWTTLQFDAQGYLSSAYSDDPALSAAALPELREFARRNAEFFHMEPAMADQIATLPNGIIEIVDAPDNSVHGEIVFGHGTPKQPMFGVTALYFVGVTAKIPVEDVVKRVAGKPYTEVTTFSDPPHLDCGMMPGGGNCASTVIATERRDISPAAKDVTVQTVLYRDGDQIRLVRCVDLQAIKPFPDAAAHHAHAWGRTYVAKSGAAALPLVVDAVTGETLALKVDSCNQVRNFR